MFTFTAAKGAISSATAPISVLVGNKSDLRDGTIDSRAEVTYTEGKEFAQSIGCQFFETSAVSSLQSSEKILMFS